MEKGIRINKDEGIIVKRDKIKVKDNSIIKGGDTEINPREENRGYQILSDDGRTELKDS